MYFLDVENEELDQPKRQKRGQGVQTKAYKEPKRDKVGKKFSKTTLLVKSKSTFQPNNSRPTRAVSNTHIKDPKRSTSTSSGVLGGRKVTRASTVSKTVETVRRQQERAVLAKKLLVNLPED